MLELWPELDLNPALSHTRHVTLGMSLNSVSVMEKLKRVKDENIAWPVSVPWQPHRATLAALGHAEEVLGSKAVMSRGSCRGLLPWSCPHVYASNSLCTRVVLVTFPLL